MRNKYFKLIYLLLLLTFGCSGKRKEGIMTTGKFPESTQLKEGIPAEFNSVGYANLQIIDTCLIIFNPKSDNLFEVYSTVSHNRIGGFGKRGRGPGEFFNLELTGQISLNKETNMPQIHVYELESERLTYIDLYASLHNPNHINASEVMPDVGFFITKIIYKDDSLLHFRPENEARMMVYNFYTKEVKTTAFLPEIGIPIIEKNKWVVYHSVFAVNDRLKKIAAAPLMLGQIDFFDSSGNYVHSTNFDDLEKYRNDLAAEDIFKTNLKQNIVEIKQDKDNILALDIDVPYESILANQIPGNSKVLQFDWDGNPVREFLLDMPVTSIAYSAANKRLYVFNPYNEDHSVWYYDLGK